MGMQVPGTYSLAKYMKYIISRNFIGPLANCYALPLLNAILGLRGSGGGYINCLSLSRIDCRTSVEDGEC